MTNIIKLETPKFDSSFRTNVVRPSIFDSFGMRSHQSSFLGLINLSLNRSTLDQVVNAIETGNPISKVVPESSEGSAYLAKILREEVLKQFSTSKRPLIEFILNAIDARPGIEDEAYVVNVDVTKNKFLVTDNGLGMNLQKILDTLIVPFRSDKNELNDIGRFGVGFFSNLQYCLKNPGKTSVSVNTSDGRDSYQLRIHANGTAVEDLVCSVRKINAKSKGTTVEISGMNFDVKDVKKYVGKTLDFFDPERAVVMVNRKPVNYVGSKSSSFEAYKISVDQIFENKRMKKQMRMAIDLTNRGLDSFNLYSQGVLVQSFDIAFGKIDLDLPSSVLLVEGRDEFKSDQNYANCIETSVKALLAYGLKHNENSYALMSLRELIPSFLEATGFDPEGLEDELKQICFQTETGIVDDREGYGISVKLQDFFGDEITEKMYVPKTNTGRYFWSSMLKDSHGLVTDSIVAHSFQNPPKEGEPLEVNGRSLKNLDLLPQRQISWVSLKDSTEPRSPVLYLGSDLFVNVDHPFFNEDGYIQRYGIKSSLVRNFQGDKALEEEFIHGSF